MSAILEWKFQKENYVNFVNHMRDKKSTEIYLEIGLEICLNYKRKVLSGKLRWLN